MPNHYIDRADAGSDVLACAAYIAERIKSNDGHAQSVALVIPRYLKRKDPDISAQLADELAENFSRDRLLLAVSEYCAANDDEEYALQLADALDDEQVRADAMERIAVIAAEQQRYERALEIADTLAHPEKVYAAAAFHYAKNGEDEAAAAMAEKIDFAVLRAKTYGEIASWKIEHDQKTESETWLEKAETAAVESEHLEEKLGESMEIAGLWFRAGRNDRVIKLLSRARAAAEASDARAWRDQAYFKIADLYFRAGSVDLSERTLEQIVDTYHFAACLRVIAAQKKESGNDSEALDDLEEAIALLAAQKSTEIYDSAARAELLRMIAEDLIVHDRFERSMEVAAMIEMPNTRNQAYLNIATRLAAGGKDAESLQALASIDDDDSRPMAKLSIGNAYRKADENEKAAKMLAEAHDEVEDIQALPVRSDTLNELTMSFHALGETDNAQTALRENLRLIEQIRDQYYKVYMLTRADATIMEFSLSVGDEERASLDRMATEAEKA